MRLLKAGIHAEPTVPAEHDGARSNLRCDIAVGEPSAQRSRLKRAMQAMRR